MRQTASKTGVGTTAWLQVADLKDINLSGGPVAWAVLVSGSVTYTLESTYDPIDGSEVAVPNAAVTAQTVTKEGSYSAPPYALRANVTAGAGTAKLVVIY